MPASPYGEPSRKDDNEQERDSERERDRDQDRQRKRSRRDDDDREKDRDRDRERRKEKEGRSRRDGDDARRQRWRDRDRDRDRERDRSGSRDRDRERKRDRDRGDKERERDRRRDSRSRSPTEREERRQRKEAKAAAKASAKREAELEHSRKLTELTMYSAVDNPFHDANLGQAFQWHKKQEKEKKMGLTAEEIARKDALRRIEAQEELEKLNKKRATRDVARALRDEEDTKLKRMAEDAAMAEWIAKEDSFQLEQSRRRAGIRLRLQRAKAIDFLAINLRFADATALGQTTAAIGALTNAHQAEIQREEEEEGWGWADAGFEFEIDEPWKIFDNLTMEDCVELENDIKMYRVFESSPINIDFWEAMQIVCKHHLEMLRDPDRAAGGRLYNKDVDESASKIVNGLTLQRLSELEERTHAMLNSGQPVDGEFWDLVLKKITVAKAIARLSSIHEIVLKNRLEQFKKRQREDAAKAQAEMGGVVELMEVTDGFGGDMHAEGAEDDFADDEDDFVEEYAPEMSPEPVDMYKLTPDERRLPVVTEREEWLAIYKARHVISAESFVPRLAKAHAQPVEEEEPAERPVDPDAEAVRMWRARIDAEPRDWGDSESEEEMEGDLADEIDDAVPATYDWSDKYRPRKPRYFNRVHTGYEWTQYNQTHYDKDNPPPKVVQGYKFNIFYPDLIDKSRAPTYVVKRIPDDPDTQLIVFQAGPPYEDIAFRIIRRPWEYSHRRGFKSNFDRGVLQLYFNFSRQFYKK